MEISPEYSFEGRILKLKLHTLPTWCKELTHWKRPWSWERLRAGEEEGDRGWDGWMACLTQWTWVWVSSGSWWWAGKLGVLLSMGSQRVGHDWATELTDWASFFRDQHRKWFPQWMAQEGKNLPATQETWVGFLCWGDPLKEEMATHSSILAWKISWTFLGAWWTGFQRVIKNPTQLSNHTGKHIREWLQSDGC